MQPKIRFFDRLDAKCSYFVNIGPTTVYLIPKSSGNQWASFTNICFVISDPEKFKMAASVSCDVSKQSNYPQSGPKRGLFGPCWRNILTFFRLQFESGLMGPSFKKIIFQWSLHLHRAYGPFFTKFHIEKSFFWPLGPPGRPKNPKNQILTKHPDG